MIIMPDRIAASDLVDRFPDLGVRYEVRFDQRRHERRSSEGPTGIERRRRDRRNLDINERLHRYGWVLIPAAQRRA